MGEYSDKKKIRVTYFLMICLNISIYGSKLMLCT